MLEGLIERVEAASGPDRDLDRDIMLAAGYHYEERDIGCRYDDGSVALDWVYVDTKTDRWRSTHPLKFTASLDAAMTLVPEGLSLDLRTFSTAKGALALLHPGSGASVQARAATPALALCAACLKARSAGGAE